ncbi:MAG: magnesium chelatase subunit D [Burkholderiales bacterium]|nr:magnesium chelatase subunit D [Burkholderiales bacterium]
MTGPGEGALLPWADALRAAALLAVDPHGLGGVLLHAQHGPVRERWLARLAGLLPAGTPMRRVPLQVRDDRLLGGLDLTATLQAGRPVAQSGLLAQADGGLLVLAMAERVSTATAARLCAALDTGRVEFAREGLGGVQPARVGIVALDEHTEGEEPPAARLRERLAFHLDLATVSVALSGAFEADPEDGDGPDQAASRQSDDSILAARARLPAVTHDESVLQALCAAAQALGVESLRAWVLALRAARVAAALDGRETVSSEDAALAARLVLAPRATRVPVAPPEPDQDQPDQEESDQDDGPPEPPPLPDDQGGPPPELPPPDDPGQVLPPDPPDADPTAADLGDTQALQETVLASARAAIPAGLLAQLALNEASARSAVAAGGRAGVRGRPIGSRPGAPRDGARLALIDTLRAAAPWQALRRREATAGTRRPLIEVRAADFRVLRLQERSETTTIFAVDASGSAALHRLAEAKGAVELLLADCYVRRDRVAVLAFRGRQAELLLPPTRSLARARRSLAGLPGGGGTPLASAIDAAAALALATRRRGGTPVIVLLTDARANVGLDGAGGRAQAEADARLAAHRLRAAGFTTLLIDTSPQPRPLARQFALEMGAAYLALPHADAAAMSRSVQAATRDAAARGSGNAR